MSRTAARFALLAAATLGSLLAVEGLLATRSDLEMGFSMDDTHVHYPTEFETDPTLNEFGCHDAPIAEPSPDRIVLLGDSFAASRYTSVAETPGQRLEHYTGRDVVTLAWPGWGQAEELLELRKLGKRLQPALVISLVFPMNDVGNNLPVLRSLQTRDNARMGRAGFRRGSIPLADLPGLWIPNSRLNQMLSVQRARQAQPPDGVPVNMWLYVTDPPKPELWEQGWARMAELLGETRDVVERNGDDYLVVTATTRQELMGPEDGGRLLRETYPELQTHDVDIELPQRRFASLCVELQLDCLDLIPALKPSGADANHWRFDPHWNAEGNDRAAAEIARALETRAAEPR